MLSKLKQLAIVLLLLPFLYAFTLSPYTLLQNEESNNGKEVEVLGVVKSVAMLQSSRGGYDYIKIELYGDVIVVAYKENVPKKKVYSQDLVRVVGKFSQSSFFGGHEYKRVIITDNIIKIVTS